MRVGLLLSNPNPEIGGGYTYQHDLFGSFLQLVEDSRHEFDVICEPGHAAQFMKLVEGRRNVQVAPMRAVPVPRRVRSAFRLIRRMLQYDSDGLSREAWAAKERGLHLLWSLGHYAHETFDVPFITTVLDIQHRIHPWFPEVSHGRLWRAREEYFRQYLRRAAYVITGTEEGQQEIERLYGVLPARIRVLPLPTPAFALAEHHIDVEARLAALGLKSGYLFYPAQFWAHKNHINTLYALRELHDVHRLPYEMVFVGSDKGNQSYVRKKAVELGLDKYIHFLGFVSQDDLVAIYRGADALLYATYFGPDNLPPLEAFALGCPVVASAVAGSKEQLGDAAILVPPGEPRTIAAAIRRLHDNKQLREDICARARRRAMSWTGKDYIHGVFQIIEEFDAIRRCWN